jgi:hypothetical protein
VHPDVARQLAHERLADRRREAEARGLAAPMRPRPRGLFGLSLRVGYARRAAAGAAPGTAGPRSGT